VAEKMEISEFTLSRWLRKDLSGNQLERLQETVMAVKQGIMDEVWRTQKAMLGKRPLIHK